MDLANGYEVTVSEQVSVEYRVADGWLFIV
jgi:hypothetical protein